MYKALEKEGDKMDGLWKGGKGRKEGKDGGRKEGPSLMTCNSIGIIVIQLEVSSLHIGCI